MPLTSDEIEEAKPTVRLKNQKGGYKETQEGDVFEANGGNPEDLLEDERWLDEQYRYKTEGEQISSPIESTHSAANDPGMGSCDIWLPKADESGTFRSVTPLHTVFHVMARACASERSTLGVMAETAREMIGMSSSEIITMKSDIRGIYVGISAITCLPIVLHWSEHWDKSSLSNDDVNELYDLRRDLNGRTNAKDIIWTENMLIPGNIAYLKSAIAGRLYNGEKKRFLQIMKRENNLLEAGLNPAGVAKTLPSSESMERRPVIRRFTQSGQEYDALHFKLRWPPMAALEFPKEMIAAMDQFLARHPSDNVPMNIALAAAIIYIDLADEGWLSEGFNGGSSIGPIPLGQFILYFPHMLRFVEVKHLTEFIHPGRFTACHYANDIKYSTVFNVHSDFIDIEQMRLWYSQIKSRYPKVSKSYRFRLIPASMPGTHMVFPLHCSNAEPPSIDLFRMCCLNDIRTLGLPSYHHHSSTDRKSGIIRSIAGPRPLFSKRLRHRYLFYFVGRTEVDHWRPKSDTICMALTGQARKIDTLFPDISSGYYVDNIDIAQFVKRHFDDVVYYTKDYDYREQNSEYDRDRRSARAKELYRVAAHLKIPVNKLWQSSDTGCPAWDGMETQLQQLKEQGLLESITANDEHIAARDEPERAAKRPRLSEPTSTLSPAIKERIETLMSSATALSRDWNALALYLEGESTTQETKRLLSEMHPFILSLEELPQTASGDSDNGKGSLEDVLMLAYKTVGHDPQFELKRHEKKWASRFSTFSQFGHSIERAVEDFIALKPLKDGYRYALPSINILANSPLVQDQIRIYKEIDALLKAD